MISLENVRSLALSLPDGVEQAGGKFGIDWYSPA